MTNKINTTGKLNSTRQMLVDKYIESLEKNQLPWVQGWTSKRPLNGISNTEYNGTNSLLLQFVARECNYEGNRWYTFNQIADSTQKYHKEHWHLQKGSKGVPVEFWYVYDDEDKKAYTLDEYSDIFQNNPSKELVSHLRSRTYIVYNEDRIDGLQKADVKENNINSSEFVNNVLCDMKVNYKETNEGRAYYRPTTDTIVLPYAREFVDCYEYYSTQLHEACHATGHESRLNRNMGTSFGSPEYAVEELRAEISSSFLMQEIGLKFTDKHIDNHVAYIQSWLSVLKKNPNELFRAIKDANDITDYIEEKGGITKNKDKNVDITNKEQVSNKVSSKNIDDDFELDK